MGFPRMTLWQRVSAVFVSFIVCAAVLTAEPTALPPSPKSASPTPASAPILPNEFAGWQIKGGGVRSDDPATADAANGDVLKEYGFVRLETASYTRDDGRNLTVKAALFDDASGAYGAFTYYVSEEMHAETIGQLSRNG